MFLLAFGIGMSSTPWAVCSEIFPLHVVGTANSLTTTTNWVSNFIVAWFFPLMLNSEKLKGWAFVLLALFSGLAWLFIYLLLPETANRTVKENVKAILGDNRETETLKIEKES